jgi:hypothetical protein
MIHKGVEGVIRKGTRYSYMCLSSGDFMKDGAVYEDLTDFKALKKCMEDQLEDYSMEPGVIPMDLVLFRDAIEHGIYDFL